MRIALIPAALSLALIVAACGPVVEPRDEPDAAPPVADAGLSDDECCQPCPPFIEPGITPEQKCTSLYSATQSAVECLSQDACQPHAEGCSLANPGVSPSLWCCPGQGPTGAACIAGACGVGDTDAACETFYGAGFVAHCVTSTNCQADAAWNSCNTLSSTAFCCK